MLYQKNFSRPYLEVYLGVRHGPPDKEWGYSPISKILTHNCSYLKEIQGQRVEQRLKERPSRDCPNWDGAKAYRQANQQVNQVTQSAAPAGMPQHSWSMAAATTVTLSTAELVAFCVNCAQTGHNMS